MYAALRFSALGDIAAALPVLRAFRQPPLIVTSAAGRELLADEFEDFLILRSKRLKDVLRLILELRRAPLEGLVDLQCNDRSRAVGRLSGLRRFDNAGLKKGQSATRLLHAIALKTGAVGDLDTAFSPKPNAYIVLNAGSSPGWESKRLPLDLWQEIGRILWERFELPFRLPGAPDERPYLDQVLARLPGRGHRNLGGATDLPAFKALLHDACLTVSTDSAAMHLSAACKTPTIGLFGPTNWVRSAPFGPWSTVAFSAARYPDRRPPEKSQRAPGDYFAGLDIRPALERLADFLPQSGA